MQSRRSVRRKIKKELDSLQCIKICSDNNNDLIEREDSLIVNSLYMPSTSTGINSQSIKETSISSCRDIPDIVEINVNENCNLSNTDQSNNNSIPSSYTKESTNSTSSSSIKDDLCKWIIECNVPQSTANKLLYLMKQREIINTNELPWDTRTLLATPRSISSIRIVEPGQYYHFGLASGIIRHASSNMTEIKIIIGIDGLPIAKSSNSQLWPILAYISNDTTKTVFPVGIYHGYAKPKDSNDFLVDFISEAKELVTNGIILNNCNIKVSFGAFICDSPAKAFVLKLKGHSGFSSCTRCIQVGEHYLNRVCYPYCNFSAKRTHESYASKAFEEHHIGNTLSRLIEIPGLDVVTMFPLDYMHLVALGVVKKLILLWLHTGPVQTRIQGRNINLLSNSLLNIKQFIPIDFPRKTRLIQDVGRYKASELRFFIVYVGPIVLKNVIIDNSYTNFMALHVAMIILLSPDFSCYLNYANELLHYFVRTFENIYGRQHISHNVHGLLHLPDDYINFGPLDNASAFPFENYMKELKSKVRKHEKPLEQLVNRYEEMYKLPASLVIKQKFPVMSKQHKSGPLVDNIKGLEFKKLTFDKFKINTSVIKESYVLTNNRKVVKCLNFVKTNQGSIKLVGTAFEIIIPLYKKPVDSTIFDIYIVKNLSNKLSCWDYLDIKKKIMLIEHENNLIAMPIIHT